MILSQVSFQDKTSQNQPATTKNPVQNSNYSVKSSQNPDNSDFNQVRKTSPPGDDQSHDYIQKCLERISQYSLVGESHIEKYLNDQRRRCCRPNTIKNSSLDILLFFKFLKKIGQPCLEAITKNDVSSFIEHEQDRGLKPATVSTRLRTLYAFLGYLAERDIVSPDLLKKKLRIKVPDPLPRAIDPEDIRAFLSVIRKTRDRAMMLILLRTGMRIGELLNTRVDDVHLSEKRIDIVEARKTRTGRVVYLSKDAEKALKNWLNERDSREPYLFYSFRRDRDMISYTGARRIFNKYMAEAGLAHKGYSLHCLRHTFASELLNAGMRLECLQQVLGHSCIEMTRRYARLTDITRREEYFKAMDKIEKGEINGSYQCDS
jgi:integrase/recombinase XerD